MTTPLPLTPLPREPYDAFLALIIYCHLPRDERSVKAAWDIYYPLKNNGKTPPQNPSGQFKNWAVNFNWKSRAKAYDAYILSQGYLKSIDERVSQMVRLLDYRDNFVEFFQQGRIVNARLTDRLNHLIDITQSGGSDIDTEIQRLKELSIVQKNLSQDGKLTFESWGVLLGLDKLLDYLAVATQTPQSRIAP